VIVFEDEFASAFTGGVAPTWAPRGHPPILKRVGYFRRVFATAVGLTTSGRIFTRHYAKAIKGPQMVETLEYFRQQLCGPFIVIWDGARAHRAGVIQTYLAQHPEISLELLPTYAPELNPEEYCHGYVKQQLRNLLADDALQLRAAVDREFARVRRRPQLVLSFFHHAGLALKHFF